MEDAMISQTTTMKSLSEPFKIIEIDSNSPMFDEVQILRRGAYGRDEAGNADLIDGYSHHFVATSNGLPIAAVRITRRIEGKLECEDHYPGWILDRFGSTICAASRMCVSSQFPGTHQVVRELIKAAWQHEIQSGIRLDLTKVRREMIPYYLRLGYLFVRKSCFLFDKWDIPCGLIAYPANERHEGQFSDLFCGLNMQCDLSAPEIRDRFTSCRKTAFADFDQFQRLCSPGFTHSSPKEDQNANS